MVLDAVERLGIEPSFCAGHSLGEYTALTATGALAFDEGVRLVGRARRGDARRPATEQPGHDGRGARPRRRPGRGRLPPRRRRRVGRQLQRPRPGRHRRRRPKASPRRRAVAKELGAKKVHAAAGVRRVPHAVHGAGPRPAAQGDRRTPTRATPRCPVDLQRRRPRPRHAATSGPSLLSAQLCSPVRWQPACSRSPSRRHHRSSSSVPAACSPAWPSAPSPAARTISVATPEDLDRLLEWRRAAHRAERRRRARGRAPLRHRAARRQPGGRRVRAEPAIAPDGARSRSARCSATSATTRCARPSPGRCMGCSPSPANGSRCANPSPGCARLRSAVTPSTAPRRRASPAGARRCPTKILTNADLEADARHDRRVDRRAHRHPRAPHRRHHRRPGDRGRAAGAGPMAGVDAGRHRPGDRSPPPRPTRPMPATAADRAARARHALRRVRPQRRVLAGSSTAWSSPTA